MSPFWVSAFLDLAPGDVERGVAFWSTVTGWAVSPTRGERDEFVTLVPPDGDDLLRAQALAAGPSRLHLDLHVDDPRATADRALALGATELADRGYVVMTSPAGLTFCLVTHPASTLPSPVAWPGGRSQVDQVSIDVGPARHDAEHAFWQAVTGFSPSVTDEPSLSRLDGVAQPLRFLVQRLDDEQPARLHLDLAADDREAEVARHLLAGATFVGPGRGWTVLADPSGLLYCVTDRTPRG